jgi:hypothetical protein
LNENGKEATVSRLFMALIVTVGLSGCHTSQQPVPQDDQSKTSRIQELIAGKGGPRVVNLNLGGGRVDALPDPYDRSNVVPGFVSVSGIRITEGNKKTVGIILSLSDSTSAEEKESRKTSIINMDAEEALEFKKAMQQEIDYALACMKNPPKHQGDMIWRSAEGLSIAVSSHAEGAAFFTLSPPPKEADPSFVGLSLSLDAGRQLMAKLDDALNVANAND